LTVTQMYAALDAFADQDVAAAEKVVRADDALDIQDAEIERRAVGFIARHAPVADDLRRPIAALKVASQLERCGDLAKNIAKRVGRLEAAVDEAQAERVSELGRLAAERLNAVVNAYRQDDAQAAYRVWQSDTEIDERHDGVLRDIIGRMIDEPRTVADSTHLLFIAKNLERIGDHATNIAELVHYQITGTDLEDRPKL
jgi:phosphate transport system protein